jgi:hypothetical protein
LMSLSNRSHVKLCNQNIPPQVARTDRDERDIVKSAK